MDPLDSTVRRRRVYVKPSDDDDDDGVSNVDATGRRRGPGCGDEGGWERRHAGEPNGC